MKSYMKFKEYLQQTISESALDSEVSAAAQALVESIDSTTLEQALEGVEASEYAAWLFSSELTEEPLTAAKRAKKEKILAALKKNATDFEKRYGDRAKEVMHAIATKTALSEDAMATLARKHAMQHMSTSESGKHEGSESSSEEHDDHSDADKHIVSQLNHAVDMQKVHQDSDKDKEVKTKPGADVTFKDGSTHFVHGDHAAKVLHKLLNIPANRGRKDATEFVAQSHHNFMQAHAA